MPERDLILDADPDPVCEFCGQVIETGEECFHRNGRPAIHRECVENGLAQAERRRVPEGKEPR